MKRTSFLPWFLVLVLLILLIWAWFFRHGPVDEIPYNREAAKEHVIPFTSAIEYVNSYRGAKAELQRQLQDSGYLDRNFNLPAAEMFNRDIFAALLDAKGAEGIRIYLGLNEKKEVCFVMVPVDGKGNDMRGRIVNEKPATAWIPGISSAYALPPVDDEAAEKGHRCPTICPSGSDLYP
jgi:hypothetical protein